MMNTNTKPKAIKNQQKYSHNLPLMLMTPEGQIDFCKVTYAHAGKKTLRVQLITEQQYKNLAGV